MASLNFVSLQYLVSLAHSNPSIFQNNLQEDGDLQDCFFLVVSCDSKAQVLLVLSNFDVDLAYQEHLERNGEFYLD